MPPYPRSGDEIKRTFAYYLTGDAIVANFGVLGLELIHCDQRPLLNPRRKVPQSTVGSFKNVDAGDVASARQESNIANHFPAVAFGAPRNADLLTGGNEIDAFPHADPSCRAKRELCRTELPVHNRMNSQEIDLVAIVVNSGDCMLGHTRPPFVEMVALHKAGG